MRGANQGDLFPVGVLPSDLIAVLSLRSFERVTAKFSDRQSLVVISLTPLFRGVVVERAFTSTRPQNR
jgi:hypothetical protein